MKIAVVHHSLNIPGGAERLCLILIEALKKEGYDVTLATIEKTNWSLIRKNFGTIVLPDSEKYLTGLKFSSYLTNRSIASLYFIAFILQLFLRKLSRRHFLVINTFGDVVNSIADITYVHFPLRAAQEFSQVPAFLSESMWRIIIPCYSFALSLLDRVSPGVLLTNSKFMQRIIEAKLHRRPLVVYPPVEVETICSRYFKSRKNGQLVAIISSYSPKRHLEQVPLIAKNTKTARFIIMGKADEYSQSTLLKLKKQIKAFGVEDRVELLINVPINKLLETLSEAKVYLHVMPNDHFGISLVEAMAAGCTPVVHRSGGPWLDILDEQQGKYGFSFNSLKEAAELIEKLVFNEKLRSEIASRALLKARDYDRSAFMKRFVEVVGNVVNF